LRFLGLFGFGLERVGGNLRFFARLFGRFLGLLEGLARLLVSYLRQAGLFAGGRSFLLSVYRTHNQLTGVGLVVALGRFSGFHIMVPAGNGPVLKKHRIEPTHSRRCSNLVGPAIAGASF
jgi:hypothetical protein